jgi:ADP-heptose:LPS heptosyltransferase
MQEIRLKPNDDIKKILIITAERLGDALFLTPAIRLLKKTCQTFSWIYWRFLP